MKEKLTNRQQEIFEFIRERIRSDGIPPTMREIGQKFDIRSTNGVREALAVLEKKGYIRRKPYLSRGIELADEPSVPFEPVPIVGRVAAGMPILAVENLDGHFAVDKSFLPNGDVFTLQVTGESMKDEGINDGDFVLVRKQDSARRGEIVVAVIGDEATVKKFFPERGKVRLEPANARFGPIIVEKNTPGFFIAGKVVGLMRRM
jgi:repressor LexA